MKALTYNVEKILENGVMFFENGVKKVLPNDYLDGIAVFNVTAGKMEMIGCTQADKQKLAKYLVH